MIRQGEPGPGDAIIPLDLAKQLPFKATVASDRREWVSLQALRYRDPPSAELFVPPMTHHWLCLYLRPAMELSLQYEGGRREDPPPVGSIMVVPAGCSIHWRWRGASDTLHVYLEPGLVARVAAEAFDLDPARTLVPPLVALDLPQLRAAMLAVEAELTTGSAGGDLAVESLANVMAVQLIRSASRTRCPASKRDGALSRRKLHAVVEYIEAHLDASLTLGQMATVARVSPYHFARQFKAATGMPPHQYVIARRVERARQLLQEGDSLSLAKVAARAGFSDQSQLSHHFKRIVGISPGQFRSSAERE